MSITTRARGVVLAGLSLSLVLSGCSSDDDNDGDSAGSSSSEGSSAFPVTIEHAYGETEIPEEPTRVVSLGYTEQDAILAFGVVPVAVRYAFGPEDDVFFPWADEAAGDAEPEILDRTEVSAEQIAALDPDLIMAVTAGLTEAEYDTLSGIAPVVVQPEEYPAFGTPWQDQTLITGRALGQEERAEELVAEVEAQFEEARAAHPELEGKTVTLSGVAYEGEYPFHSSTDTRTQFFLDFGMVVAPQLDEIAGDEFYGTVSQEQADLLDADVLLWQSGSDEERAQIEGDPILNSIPAVAEGRALFVEGSDYDALQFASALSLPYLLESLVPKISEIVTASAS
ncbi:iron-siderophore ABC transporter substrate-binding protein [Blastococcus sp. TF02A-26]|uniref:iron-siderophore ABC transporter substrate-binding protein n=1 Tax=Blastococcus sp. TF02A-26 TaxID=2250577 RepID=UPI000DEB1592|nr:iron-siderophore ABC transporter substrate-binding protein [Blastococcus sp. TF02A-26]RBY81021.1 iron-siderophore ABC transporter substrate-binding protein [Blastococcus sp. TF02A-26]